MEPQDMNPIDETTEEEVAEMDADMESAEEIEADDEEAFDDADESAE
ncbi:MAG: hypothetical protein RL150_694 [Candidatus Parcubacteria bacterium]|jgi:hypothetical protein